MADFIRVPFGVEGDVAEIPQSLQTNGKVSMATGFTFDYERDPANDPNAKDVPRLETNWLYYVITDAIRQYQTEGAFPFITSEVNGGTAFPYVTGARCRYEGAVYESLVDNNTALPTDATKWRNTSKVDKSTGYELCEIYSFRHPTLRPGFMPAQGGLLEDVRTLYPEAWEYLVNGEGKVLCKTEAEWQAMTTAIWATLADGTKVGWNGIGGAPFYAPNTATGALRLPDLRGMYAEAAGFDSLGVGGVHGDAIRQVLGGFWYVIGGGVSSGAFTSAYYRTMVSMDGSGLTANRVDFNSDRVVPVASKNQPRAWGSLACVYLGLPS